MKLDDHVARRLLAVIATLLVVGALRLTRHVTLPLAFALFLVAVFWPVQRTVERRAGRGVGVLASLAALLGTAGLLGWALWAAAAPAFDSAPGWLTSPGAVFERLGAWAQQKGLPFADRLAGASPEGGGVPAVLDVSGRDAVTALTGAVLVVAFYALAMFEATRWGAKLARVSRQGAPAWTEPLGEMARAFQHYVAVRTGVGAVTGVAAGLFAWAIGLELAIVWGALNFLLNYIPTLGSIAAVVPPTLYALAEHGPGMALLVAAGIGGVQLVMGNWIDPLVQGRVLRLSPLVVLLSVVFWGWVWGIAGAFLGIPLTVALVVGTSRFERTRWVATLLGERPDEAGEDEVAGDSTREAA